MGFFSSTRAVEESAFTGNTTLEALMEDSSVYPSRQVNLIEASMEMLIDIEENHNTFFKYIGANELSAVEETGEEFVYTEGVLDSIIETIKSFLNKIWEKIKALFKRFMMTIDSYTKNDKEFCNKYRKEIFSKSIDSDFTFKGYKWKIDDKVIKLMEDMGKLATVWLDDFNKNDWQSISTDETQKNLENFEDSMEKARGEFLKALGISSNAVTLEEFRKELHEYFRSGDTEKQELDSKDPDADPNHCFTELVNSADTKKKAQNAFKANKKNIDNTEKEFLRIQKEHIRDLPNEKDPNADIEDPSTTITSTTTTNANANEVYKKLVDIYKRETGKSDINLNGTVVNFGAANNSQKPIIYAKIYSYLKSNGNSEVDTFPANYRKSTFSQTTTTTGTTTKKDMNSRKSKALGLQLKFINADKQCLITLDSEFLNALKERSRQYKALLIAVVHYKSKNESAVQESAYLEDVRSKYTRTSFFSGLSLR